MTNEALEQVVIDCLKENLELSGEPVPPITRDTKPALDLGGFDSLRTLEVVVSLEEKLECDLPPEKLFENKKLEDVSVKGIAHAIDEIIKAKKK
ncbi:acyl carrier protein [Alteromonadaceae bacterium 2753L.S.0a.02]|nr:acyl carrier protein [Alteromonadaceae bacterium 2753L.S.0a.02]